MQILEPTSGDMPAQSWLILVGAGGHARVVANAALAMGYRIFAVYSESTQTERLEGLQVQSLDLLLEASSACMDMAFHVAIGNPFVRKRITLALQNLGLKPVKIIHPAASVAASALVGAGAFIAAGAIVAVQAQIGLGSIVNHGACVDHDCHIGDFAHVGPGANLGGFAQIGQMAWIGIGSTIRDRAYIGEQAFLGAGSLVLRALAPHALAFGVPAKVQRMLDIDEFPEF